jgi:hypothetical protein
MILGQSSAIIACMAMDEQKAVQDLEYNMLHEALINQKQVLK